jgi:hypothetical protein
MVNLVRGQCPACAAYELIDMTERFDVKWNEAKKEFDVFLLLNTCFMCQRRLHGEVVKRLPAEIAQHSTCACGSILELGNFQISQDRDEITLSAKYYCPKCGDKSVLEKIKDTLINIWRDTTKIEVGPEGVKYEKAAKEKAP